MKSRSPMNPRTATPDPPDTRLTDAAFEAALRDDGILPSSGFTASVMAAVESQSSAPAALAFPWKRAVPGLAAAVVVLVLLLGILIAAAVRAIHTAPRLGVPASTTVSSFNWHLELQPILHSTASAGAFWLILALTLSGLCLLLCRRLVSSN